MHVMLMGLQSTLPNGCCAAWPCTHKVACRAALGVSDAAVLAAWSDTSTMFAGVSCQSRHRRTTFLASTSSGCWCRIALLSSTLSWSSYLSRCCPAVTALPAFRTCSLTCTRALRINQLGFGGFQLLPCGMFWPHLFLGSALCQLLLVSHGHVCATCQLMCPCGHGQPSSGSCTVCCLRAGTTYLGAVLQSVLTTACTLCMQAHQSPYIRHATQLEQWLMEGAYNKVLGAKSSAPDAAYATLMERLVSTVRCAQCHQQQLGPAALPPASLTSASDSGFWTCSTTSSLHSCPSLEQCSLQSLD